LFSTLWCVLYRTYAGFHYHIKCIWTKVTWLKWHFATRFSNLNVCLIKLRRICLIWQVSCATFLLNTWAQKRNELNWHFFLQKSNLITFFSVHHALSSVKWNWQKKMSQYNVTKYSTVWRLCLLVCEREKNRETERQRDRQREKERKMFLLSWSWGADENGLLFK